MFGRLLPLACLLVAACSNPPPQPPAPTPKPPAPKPELPTVEMGTYTLQIDPGAAWQKHALIIDDIDADTLKGKVQIDWGIGPEGRAPGPDERLHTKAWTAPREASGHLVFEVSVGEMDPAVHAFDLWICPSAGPERCAALKGPGLTGEVRIASKLISPGIWSVTALPKR